MTRQDPDKTRTTTWDGQVHKEVLHHEIASVDGSDWPRHGVVPWQIYASAADLHSEGTVGWDRAAGELVIRLEDRNLVVRIGGIWLSGMQLSPTVTLAPLRPEKPEREQGIWRRVRSWRRGRRTTLAP